MEWLRDNLPELVDEGRRLLVFSQFTEMLSLVELELERTATALPRAHRRHAGARARRGGAAVPGQGGADPLAQPEGRWRGPEPHRRRHRDPPRPVVEPGRRTAGHRARAPHRPGPAGVRLQAGGGRQHRRAHARAAAAQDRVDRGCSGRRWRGGDRSSAPKTCRVCWRRWCEAVSTIDGKLEGITATLLATSPSSRRMPGSTPSRSSTRPMNPPPPRTSTLVYSTESGRICPGCGQSVAACTCKSKTGNVGKGDGTVRVSRETKGRGGKAVTVIRGVPLAAAGLAALGKQLAQRVRDGWHAERRCAGSAGRSRRTRDRIVEAERLAGEARRRLNWPGCGCASRAPIARTE